MPVYSQELRNKIILISEPVATVHTVAIGFWFSTGSRDEPSEKRGVTHFVEHMLFKGTQTHSPFDIASRFDRMGGYINAFTERETVCMYCVVPSQSVSEALDCMCDMVTNSVFAQDQIDRERVVIESEIIAAADDPEEAALDAVSESVWPNQPLSASISGTVEQVESLTRSDLFTWYTDHFVKGSLVVSIAGAFDFAVAAERLSELPEHQAQPSVLINAAFSGIETTDSISPHRYGNQKPVWHSGVNFIPAHFQQEQFFVLYPISYPVTFEKYAALAVVNALTGDTMSSRLFQVLREQGGYCYTVYSFCSFYEDTGCWCAYASSAKKNILRIARDLSEELRKLAADNERLLITDAEIEAAKEHLCGEEIISSEDMEYRMKRLARNFLSGHAIRSTEELVSVIRSVDRNAVKQCLTELLNQNDQSIVVFGPRTTRHGRRLIMNYFLHQAPGGTNEKKHTNSLHIAKRGKAARLPDSRSCRS